MLGLKLNHVSKRGPRPLSECLSVYQLTKMKLLCYSQYGRLLLPKQVRYKLFWKYFSQDEDSHVFISNVVKMSSYIGAWRSYSFVCITPALWLLCRRDHTYKMFVRHMLLSSVCLWFITSHLSRLSYAIYGTLYFHLFYLSCDDYEICRFNLITIIESEVWMYAV